MKFQLLAVAQIALVAGLAMPKSALRDDVRAHDGLRGEVSRSSSRGHKVVDLARKGPAGLRRISGANIATAPSDSDPESDAGIFHISKGPLILSRNARSDHKEHDSKYSRDHHHEKNTEHGGVIDIGGDGEDIWGLRTRKSFAEGEPITGGFKDPIGNQNGLNSLLRAKQDSPDEAIVGKLTPTKRTTKGGLVNRPTGGGA